MTWTQQQWFDARDLLRRIYLEELGRDVIGDPDALTNWLCHMREDERDEQWLRERFRESEEYKQRHPTPIQLVQPVRPQPHPTSLQGIQVTDVQDGDIIPRMYSYWPNAWVREDGTIFMFCGVRGTAPQFFSIDPDGGVWRYNALIPYSSESEGWYWDTEGRVCLIKGAALCRINPFNGAEKVLFDISHEFPNHNLWQAHSSVDGRCHVATVRENSNDFNPHVATVIVRDGQKTYVGASGKQDEAHITKDGRWVVIEEDDNNLIIRVEDPSDRRQVLDANGALSHIDCGQNFIVGEDNYQGACIKLNLDTQERTVLFSTWGMGHVSVAHRPDDVARCIVSSAQTISEVRLDGSGVTVILQHRMIGIGSDYDTQVKANLDPSGRVACYMSNNGVAGGRQDVFIARL